MNGKSTSFRRTAQVWRGCSLIIILALAPWVATGCSDSVRQRPAEKAVAEKKNETLVANLAGPGRSRSLPFDIKGLSMRVEWELIGQPREAKAIFSIEHVRSSGLTEPFTTRVENIGQETKGTFTMGLVPGTYQIKVDHSNNWRLRIYDRT